MHEAKDFSTYFPVIFCLESGSSVTKNLEAVCPLTVPCAPHTGTSLSPMTSICVCVPVPIPLTSWCVCPCSLLSTTGTSLSP